MQKSMESAPFSPSSKEVTLISSPHIAGAPKPHKINLAAHILVLDFPPFSVLLFPEASGTTLLPLYKLTVSSPVLVSDVGGNQRYPSYEESLESDIMQHLIVREGWR